MDLAITTMFILAFVVIMMISMACWIVMGKSKYAKSDLAFVATFTLPQLIGIGLIILAKYLI